MGFWIAICTLGGLCVGSFLNVVAHRLPKMLEAQWADELAQANGQEPAVRKPFDLCLPASHCPSCNNRLKAIHNVPVFSFIFLKGRCGFCKTRIGWRYPVVEMASALLFGGLAWLYPPGLLAVSLMGFAATLFVLALIDLDTYLLPDDLTLPLVWAGLIVNLAFEHVPLQQAVLGASLGYGLLWSIYKIFKILTGKEGMGYGDFKLLAAIGAWLGATSIFTVLLFASLTGIFFGLGLQWLRGKNHNEPFPFGPSLVMGAFAWLFGLDFSQWL